MAAVGGLVGFSMVNASVLLCRCRSLPTDGCCWRPRWILDGQCLSVVVPLPVSAYRWLLLEASLDSRWSMPQCCCAAAGLCLQMAAVGGLVGFSMVNASVLLCR